MLSLLKTAARKGTNFARGDRKRARLNRFINQYELRRQVVRLRSYPSTIFIEPASICNLKCPFCTRGNDMTTFPKVNMKREDFYKVVSNIRQDLLFNVNFFHLGEPLLNPNLFEYIEHFSRQGVATHLSVNFAAKRYSSDYHEGLVSSGITSIIVSIDGATQETYEKYRVGGKLDVVMDNVRGLAEARRRLESKSPHIIFRMLLNKYNENEQEAAQKLADEAGVDFWPDESFRVPSQFNDEWLAESMKNKYGTPDDLTVFGRRRLPDIHTECRQLWDTLHITADGSLMPCCVSYEIEHNVGSLVESHIDDLWNNHKMVRMREYVTNVHSPELDFVNGCTNCSHRFCTSRS